MRFSGLLVQFLFVVFVVYEGQNHTADNTETHAANIIVTILCSGFAAQVLIQADGHCKGIAMIVMLM